MRAAAVLKKELGEGSAGAIIQCRLVDEKKPCAK